MAAQTAGAVAEDPAKRIMKCCLKISTRINQIYLLFNASARVLILPQLNDFQYRTYWVFFQGLFCCEMTQLFFAKCLYTYYGMENLLLLLSFGSLFPFAKVIYNLWRFIPCPALASAISNSALVASLVVLVVLSVGGGNLWSTYVRTMTVWPWLVLTSMVSRLYIERQAGKNPFSPVKDLPFLGMLGSTGWILAMISLKSLNIADCVALLACDNIIAALTNAFFLGKRRRKRHFQFVKVYCIMVILVLLYNSGDIASKGALIKFEHLVFLASRTCFVLRSSYAKYTYSTFHKTKEPAKPPENLLLFQAVNRPVLHRFRGFPSPMLLTLDCIFDSGLRDTELHGMGPLGTEDLYNLTENAYLLGLATAASLVWEGATMEYGLLPQYSVKGISTAAQMATTALEQASQDGSATVSSSGGSSIVKVSGSPMDTQVTILLVAGFTLSRLCTAGVTGKLLFDRASPISFWKFQPALILAPVVMLDILQVNPNITNFQFAILLLLLAVVAAYRSDLWNIFKRKYLLLQTQDLHYQCPQALRQLQRKTLLQYLAQKSTDDYEALLLDTAVSVGANVRELARDVSIQVWDPSPSSTAAWKLAFSLITRTLRRQKLLRRNKMDAKQEILKFIEGICLEMAENAMLKSDDYKRRIGVSATLARDTNKRRAIQAMRDLALRRRKQRLMLKGVAKQKQLALPGPNDTGSFPQLQAPPSALNSLLGTTFGSFRTSVSEHLSLSPGGSMEPDFDASQEVRLSVPGEVAHESSIDLLAMDSLESIDYSSGGRGIFNEHFSEGKCTASGSGGATTLVVAFGDGRRGQLGVEPAQAARLIARNVNLVVDELRGQQPVQIKAAGVTSAVVGSKGQVWAFGSNRSMELGARKDIAQVSRCERVKSVRHFYCVQIASSQSASGQAHTLALSGEGEVHCYGTSSSGALGQGPDKWQCAPTPLNFTILKIPQQVKMVSAGARHSLLLTDAGRLYSMGDNTHGQLGIDIQGTRMADTPTPVGGEDWEDVRIKIVTAGDNHTIAVTEDDKVFSWGGNANGQLGLGKLADQALPQLVPSLSGLRTSAIACGARHSLAVTSEGTQTWAWGSNVQGQLGVGQSSEYQRSLPTLVATLSGKKGIVIIQITAASCHSLALAGSGEVYAFGQNSHGQLGFATVKKQEPTTLGKGTALPPGANPATQHQLAQQQAAKDRAKARNKMETDMPTLHDNGVEMLWLPVRVVSLSQYRVQAVSTADMHTLTIAQHRHGS
eukprot:TRINITY_DN57279_c0_g1_i1.p1 TRINITY_DN57279_c0_g1~~TRINITY_DN57279_c0_g1_i1.p1  ORF type:complete len:1267 (-),score=179.17 TRINITY_DN57279_c0_g1_i1:153-3884(-)